MNIEKDKVKGTFWGLAIGDALGAPVEFQPRDTFALVTDIRSGGVFRLPAGAWTDDTAMALCLADSLLAFPNFDPSDLMERFRRWIEYGENTSTGQCIGVGQNTLRVIGHCLRTGELSAPPTHEKSDGNGAIMRLAPVVCLYWNNEKKARRIAACQSRVTHYSAKSEAACEFMALAICRLISGLPWSEATNRLDDATWPEEVRAIATGNWRNKTRNEIRSTGYVIDTLEAALWAVETTNNFEEAVLVAVNLGHDADTVGAVTGQLAGARYGYDQIPRKWVEKTVKGTLLGSIVEEIWELASTYSREEGCMRINRPAAI